MKKILTVSVRLILVGTFGNGGSQKCFCFAGMVLVKKHSSDGCKFRQWRSGGIAGAFDLRGGEKF